MLLVVGVYVCDPACSDCEGIGALSVAGKFVSCPRASLEPYPGPSDYRVVKFTTSVARPVSIEEEVELS